MCAEHAGGGITITAEGFVPGSELLVEMAGFDPAVLQIEEHGRPGGVTGFLSLTAVTGPVVIAVSGTAADGRDVTSEIVSGG